MMCEGFNCGRTVKNNRWARTKATGWFFTRDGRAFCPNHVPAWVPAWRRQQGKP